MKKNVWIWNHYATNTFFDQGGRHYWFAENLIKEGYKPTIFCATTIHNSNEIVDTKGKKYSTDSVNDIPYVFVNTPKYKGNGKKRVLNMISFYRGLFKTAKEYAKLNGKPDVILASSVHPLTLVAGIKIAKKFDIPCICEVRDLWPESIVAYGLLKRKSLISKLLFQGEKWIYKKADSLIFTVEGGKDYVIKQGWNKENCGPIDTKKIHHINNGIDLEVFNYNKNNYKLADDDLTSDSYKVIYTGSLRLANDSIRLILDSAKRIQKIDNNIKYLIYGDGSEKERYVNYCNEQNIKNVKFKGFVEKKYIPYILSKANLSILNCVNSDVLKYGGSQNKLFDYLASGNPVISGENSKYSVISRHKCGLSRSISDCEDLSNIILDFKNLDENELEKYRKQISKAAELYDYSNLTKKLINIIEN